MKAAFFLDGGRIPARVIPAKMLLPVVSRQDTRKLLGIVTMQAIAAAMAREAGDGDAGAAPSSHSPSAST